METQSHRPGLMHTQSAAVLPGTLPRGPDGRPPLPPRSNTVMNMSSLHPHGAGTSTVPRPVSAPAEEEDPVHGAVPPPEYSPIPMPGEHTVESLPGRPAVQAQQQHLVPPVPVQVPPPVTPAATWSEPVHALIDAVVHPLATPAASLTHISPLPAHLVVTNTRATLRFPAGTTLWYRSDPPLHVLVVHPTPTVGAVAVPTPTMSVTVLPVLPVATVVRPHPLAAPQPLPVLQAAAQHLHARQGYVGAAFSATPAHDAIQLAVPGSPPVTCPRVSVTAMLARNKDPGTGKTPRRVYVAVGLPPALCALGGAGGVLVAYADAGGRIESGLASMLLGSISSSLGIAPA
ncbi:hypothetical protein H9P43_000592 [Blastocladiella emersonii ATCC 22665]|nr:hypothetical protein H9P43_000592 [Blastocladiella emersonii ATCC 22665]